MKNGMEYFVNINNSLTNLTKLIKDNTTFNATIPEIQTLRKEIKEMMMLVRELEYSGIIDTMEKKEQYFVAKTVGRLEAIYSILYPKEMK